MRVILSLSHWGEVLFFLQQKPGVGNSARRASEEEQVRNWRTGDHMLCPKGTTTVQTYFNGRPIGMWAEIHVRVRLNPQAASLLPLASPGASRHIEYLGVVGWISEWMPIHADQVQSPFPGQAYIFMRPYHNWASRRSHISWPSHIPFHPFSNIP